MWTIPPQTNALAAGLFYMSVGSFFPVLSHLGLAWEQLEVETAQAPYCFLIGVAAVGAFCPAVCFWG